MWPNPQETADLVTITEEILNRKLHYLCSAVFSEDADGNVDIEFLQHRKEVEIFLLYQKLSPFISKTQSFWWVGVKDNNLLRLDSWKRITTTKFL